MDVRADQYFRSPSRSGRTNGTDKRDGRWRVKANYSVVYVTIPKCCELLAGLLIIHEPGIRYFSQKNEIEKTIKS